MQVMPRGPRGTVGRFVAGTEAEGFSKMCGYAASILRMFCMRSSHE